MRKLIINADDFGLHEDINNGIIDAFQNGCLTSTSIMASAPAFDHAISLARANPTLGIGIHLTLVGGVAPVLPVEEVPTLVDENGLFYPNYIEFIKRFYLGKVKKVEIIHELRAQIRKVLETEIPVTHVDSHQHLHVLPGITSMVVSLCRQHNLTNIRLPEESYSDSYGYSASLGRKIGRDGLSFCAHLARKKFSQAGIEGPDYFYGMLAGGNISIPVVENFLDAMEDGVSEIMTHPGSNAEELKKLFSWGYNWEQERDTFLSSEIKEAIERNSIKLINFGGLEDE